MKIKFIRMITADVIKNNDEPDVTCFDRNSILECQVVPIGEKFSNLILDTGDIVVEVPTSAFTQYN